MEFTLCGDVIAGRSLCGDVNVGGHPVAEIPSADIVAPIFADEQVNGIAPFGQGLPSYTEHGARSTEHGAWSMEHGVHTVW